MTPNASRPRADRSITVPACWCRKWPGPLGGRQTLKLFVAWMIGIAEVATASATARAVAAVAGSEIGRRVNWLVMGPTGRAWGLFHAHGVRRCNMDRARIRGAQYGNAEGDSRSES